MGTNPYELRLQLFQEAKSICWEEYNSKVSNFDRIRENNNDLKIKYDADLAAYHEQEEKGNGGTLKYPTYPDIKPLPEYPEYPSMEEIKEKATFIRDFCDDKGDKPAPRNWREELKGNERSNYLGNTFRDTSVAPHLAALKKGTTGISS